MAKTVNKLTAIAVQRNRKPGYYADGSGLYLQVSPSGSKSWIYRFTLHQRRREMGIGSAGDVSLEQARRLAGGYRKQAKAGTDPIEARHAERIAQRVGQASAISFDDCAARYIEAHRAGWRNAKHAAQWTATLATYASPIIGDLPVKAIETAHVLKVLEPIWKTKTETATRVRQRIECVLDWATARKHRQGDNPARWRGHLDKLLPKRSKVAKVAHHPAMPYTALPAFLAALRGHEGIAARALEFVILTAARVSEVCNACWPEIDFAAKLWTVPAERMKSGRPHRVPLSDAALRVLKAMEAQRQSDHLFPGWRMRRPLSGAACIKLLRDMKHADLTVHGFRSTFRDWCAEQTNYPRELAEAALAHVLRDKTEAAYQRGDLLQRRAHLLQAWARYCAGPAPAAKVTPIRKRQRNG